MTDDGRGWVLGGVVAGAVVAGLVHSVRGSAADTAADRRMVRAMQSAALRFYGETDDPSSAAFLLSNGRWVDFSEGSGMGRVQDHRNVAHLLPESELAPESAYGAQTKNMRRWMDLTEAIRVSRSTNDYVMLDFPDDPSAVRGVLSDRVSIGRYVRGASAVTVGFFDPAQRDRVRRELDPFSPAELRSLLQEIEGTTAGSATREVAITIVRVTPHKTGFHGAKIVRALSHGRPHDPNVVDRVEVVLGADDPAVLHQHHVVLERAREAARPHLHAGWPQIVSGVYPNPQRSEPPYLVRVEVT